MGKMSAKVAEVVVNEFAEMDLGDARRDARLIGSAAALAAAPRKSFPQVFRGEADKEAFYRLLRNPAVEPDTVLAPHVEAAVERADACRAVVVAHDESELVLKGEKRRGLGQVTNSAQGLYLRTSLLVDASEARTPLGVLRLERFVHQTQTRVSASAATKRSRAKPQHEKETDWWRQAALETGHLLATHPKVIHVIDREADSYALMAALRQGGCRFVIRARHNRVLAGGEKLRDAMWQERGHFFRSVPLSRRRFVNRKGAHPARMERTAELHIRALTVTVPKPESAQADDAELTINVVHVFERNPPRGEKPIDWLLLTSEAIDGDEAMADVVDHYRARWRIEEYFKALKQGCDLQRRQLESLKTISNALAIFAPIAWALLYLRSAVQEGATTPATTFFTIEQLKMLRALCPELKLSGAPNLRDALLAIAHLGGHIRRNGDPGWEVLGRGFLDFVAAERGWRAFAAQIRDQS